MRTQSSRPRTTTPLTLRQLVSISQFFFCLPTSFASHCSKSDLRHGTYKWTVEIASNGKGYHSNTHVNYEARQARDRINQRITPERISSLSLTVRRRRSGICVNNSLDGLSAMFIRWQIQRWNNPEGDSRRRGRMNALDHSRGKACPSGRLFSKVREATVTLSFGPHFWQSSALQFTFHKRSKSIHCCHQLTTDVNVWCQTEQLCGGNEASAVSTFSRLVPFFYLSTAWTGGRLGVFLMSR